MNQTIHQLIPDRSSLECSCQAAEVHESGRGRSVGFERHRFVNGWRRQGRGARVCERFETVRMMCGKVPGLACVKGSCRGYGLCTVLNGEAPNGSPTVPNTTHLAMHLAQRWEHAKWEVNVEDL